MQLQIPRLAGQNTALAHAGFGELPRLVASLEAHQRTQGQRTLVDTRGLGKPEKFLGKDGEWMQWS